MGSISTNNHLTLDPVTINLKLAPETIVAVGIVALAVAVLGVKKFK